MRSPVSGFYAWHGGIGSIGGGFCPSILVLGGSLLHSGFSLHRNTSSLPPASLPSVQLGLIYALLAARNWPAASTECPPFHWCCLFTGWQKLVLCHFCNSYYQCCCCSTTTSGATQYQAVRIIPLHEKKHECIFSAFRSWLKDIWRSMTNSRKLTWSLFINVASYSWLAHPWRQVKQLPQAADG